MSQEGVEFSLRFGEMASWLSLEDIHQVHDVEYILEIKNYINYNEQMRSELWLDSEVTQDNICSSIISVNASTHPQHRTAEHISLRLHDASKRLHQVSSTIQKQKSTETKEPTNHQNLDHVAMVISQLAEQNQKKTKKIEELEDLLVETQNKLLKQEQRYLLQENKFIHKINQLNALLGEKEEDEVRWEEQKKQLINKLNEMSKNIKNKQSELQKHQNQQIESLKRQRDQIWRWSSLLNKNDKVPLLKDQLSDKLEDLSCMINYEVGRGENKENINLNGIINEATWKEKKSKFQPKVEDETLFKYLCVQAQSIEQLLV